MPLLERDDDSSEVLLHRFIIKRSDIFFVSIEQSWDISTSWGYLQRLVVKAPVLSNVEDEALKLIFGCTAPLLSKLLSEEILHKVGLSPTNPASTLIAFEVLHHGSLFS